ncbi:MAG: chorismate synthase [Clostridia bacterium]|nr:chorismate synthase [Clostridia bacterium]
MKNTFGQSVCVTLFGESHGPEIGAVIDGLAPGLPVDEAFIASQLALRRPAGRISTARREADPFRVVSGVFEGKTTGAPLTILIPNGDARGGYARGPLRPGHADFTAHEKYHGFEDYRGGGHFSGRITAALVAAGAVALSALKARGVVIGTHIARCAGVCDAPFGDLAADVARLNRMSFAALDEKKGEAMRAAIEAAAERGDSVGGVLETAALGLPAGVGEPWFDTVEGVLAHALFSIPAVKGVEFGAGFALAGMTGSMANDPFRLEGGRVVASTNNNGGVNGGITNGMPLLFRCAVKPTPSIAREQQTVNLATGREETIAVSGRHDPCIVHRARVVVDSVAALALCDLLAQRYGTDWLAGGAADETRERPLRDENIVLIGMPGSGKSSVARALGQMMNRPVADVDELVASKAGMSIPSIFARFGEARFRDMESEVISGLAARRGLVIATGGGSILRAKNVEALRKGGWLVMLDRPLTDLMPSPERPLGDTREKVERLYAERMPLYRAAADEIVPSSATNEATAREIQRRWAAEDRA